MRKTVFLLWILWMLSGCTETTEVAEEQPEPTIVIGYSQIGAESSWRTCSTQSILQAGKEAGVQIMFEDAEQKQENQIKAIRSFIAYQVDVIVLSPMTETGWENVLTEARNAGIPMILADRGVSKESNGLYSCYIGANFEDEGKKAAKYLIEKYKDNPLEEIHIVELFGVPDSTPATGRSEGFWKELSAYPKFKQAYSESGDFMLSRGREITNKLLEEHTEMDVLFSHNDAMTMGALEAMEAKGIRPGKDVTVISFDAEQQSMDKLVEGKINCVVECTPYLGETIIRTALMLSEGKTVPKHIYSDEEVFTEFTPGIQNLPQRGY